MAITSMSFGQLIINEVLYDPSNTDLEGDANGDGIYEQEEDAFIELVNIGDAPIDLSGYQIWDDLSSDQERFIIPPNTILEEKKALVIFGGGTPTGDFGGATVILADTAIDGKGLSLNNNGEIIVIRDSQGTDVVSFDSDALSNNPNESYTRDPDFTGEFVQHGGLDAALLFSPGTKNDGITTITPDQTTAIRPINKATVSVYPNPVINEVYVSANTPISTLTIYDITGQIIKQVFQPTSSTDLSDLNNGVYIMKVEMKTSIETIRFLKSK